MPNSVPVNATVNVPTSVAAPVVALMMYSQAQDDRP